MSYSYQPRDPRAKLREVAVKWVAAMRVTGRAPNRGIVFSGDAPSAPQVHGFLVDDRRPQASGERYLVLEDGDVLRAPEETWLAEPNDDVVMLFARALADARMGGSGWLADAGDALERVPDRRAEPRPHDGPERRSHS
ncbi:MAG: hypothetical protein NTW58_04810 [Actinobacteria bacterium]|nr:hypothetical protein [Actinomycetota bacterium]